MIDRSLDLKISIDWSIDLYDQTYPYNYIGTFYFKILF